MKKLVPILLLSLALSSCSSSGETTTDTGTGADTNLVAENYTPVKTNLVEKDTIATTLDYSGVVTANQTFNVVSTLTAEVENTYFEVGDTVNEGDLLFTVDTSNIDDQLKQLNAQVQAAEVGVEMANNQVNSISGGQYQSQVKQLESSIEAAEKQVALAEESYLLLEETYEKNKVLYENGIISKSDFENLELQYSQAKSSYESAQLQVDQLQETYDLTTNDILSESEASGELGVKQAEVSRDSAQLQLDITRKMLEDASVSAPISGIVSYKGVEKDQYVSTSSPAYTIVDMDTVLVNVKVSEKIINKITKGDTVDVYITTIQDEPFVGTVKSVSPIADQTSTYPCEIEIPNPDHTIKPGMFANTSFVLNQSNDTLIIPYEAIVSTVDEKYVYVIDGDKAKKVTIETGLTDGREIEVTSGLNVGDEVIVSGQSYITDGDTIKVVNE